VVDRLRAAPSWFWLSLIVLASVVARLSLARQMPAPFIFSDELSYSELAKSLAATGSLAIRDVPVGAGYGVLYPVLISPAYAIFDDLTLAYAAVKGINSVVMSLAAVPAYLFARRAISVPGSLLVAALTVAVPSLGYTATVMTENLFYPLALLSAWATLRVLEQPSWRRAALVLAVLAAALLTRLQGIALVAAAVTAPLVLAPFDDRWRRPRTYLPLVAPIAAAAVAAVVVQLARGSSLRGLLGAYSVVTDAGYDAARALHYWLWHLEELTLYVGVVPVAALLVILVRVRSLPAPARRQLAVTLASIFWLSLVVAVFASEHAGRIQERNLFFVAPLLFVALLVWVEHPEARDRRVSVPALAAAVALAVLFPYTTFIDTPAISDTFALLPLWWGFGHLPFGSIWGTVLIGALAGAALFLVVPSRALVVVPVAVLAYLAVMSGAVWDGHAQRSIRGAGIGALFQGIRSVPRDWIDGAVPTGATVGAVFTGVADRYTVNENEFFNRRVGPVYYIGGKTQENVPGETEVRLGADGVLRRTDGSPLRDRYVLADGSLEVDGALVARDEGWAISLWRVAGPVVRRAEVRISGLYPGDTWSGPSVRYERRNCHGGTLVVTLSGDERLFEGVGTTVIARPQGAAARTVLLGPRRERVVRLPLLPHGGSCRVTFDVSPTRNPALVLTGSTDNRELGAHFLFAYEPGP
jgi:hypothetical protein